MEEEVEEEKRGITVGEVFRVAFTQKWLILIIAVIITIAGTLGIYFGYNKTKTQYAATFTVNFTDSATGVYPDNTPFNYLSIIQLSTLESVKASDDSFANLNVTEMFNSNDIDIKQTVTTVGSVAQVSYSLTVKTKYFKNIEQARDFISKLVSVPVDYITTWAGRQKHDANLESYKNADNFADRLEYLNKQAEQLELLFADLPANFSYEKTLAAADLKSVKAQLTSVKGILNENYYVEEMATLERYKNSITALAHELKQLQDVWDKVFPDVSPDTVVRDGTYVTEATKLAQEIVDKQTSIADYSAYIKENGGSVSEDRGVYTISLPASIPAEKLEGAEKLDGDLKAINDSLATLTSTYDRAFVKMYTDTSFITINGITESGGMGVIIAFALSFVLGVIVAFAVALIVAMPKYMREKRKAATTGADDGSDNPDGETAAETSVEDGNKQ